MTSSRHAVSKILSQTQNVYEAGIEWNRSSICRKAVVHQQWRHQVEKLFLNITQYAFPKFSYKGKLVL